MSDPNIASLESIQNVSRETFSRLELYHSLLLKWQKACNLVSNNTIPDAWNRHFVDCFQLVNHIDSNLSVLDMGSGAGFPGLVLSISGFTQVTLVESDSKKVEFMKNVSRETFCNVEIINDRIQNINNRNFDVITSRALSSLTNLLDWSYPFMDPQTSYCLFPKGENWFNEIEEARSSWVFDCERFPSLTNVSSCILKIKNCRRQ
jgi:16S rRNA (guanine527-N7)-methyltransferase